MNEGNRTESAESRQRWAKELQDALDRTSEAVRTAWEATRESRLGALESAKQMVKELGQVLEQGVEAARERWESEGGPETDTTRPPGAATPPPGRPAAGTEPPYTGDTSSPEEPDEY